MSQTVASGQRMPQSSASTRFHGVAMFRSSLLPWRSSGAAPFDLTGRPYRPQNFSSACGLRTVNAAPRTEITFSCLSRVMIRVTDSRVVADIDAISRCVSGIMQRPCADSAGVCFLTQSSSRPATLPLALVGRLSRRRFNHSELWSRITACIALMQAAGFASSSLSTDSLLMTLTRQFPVASAVAS
jgi:hypothetical protein